MGIRIQVAGLRDDPPILTKITRIIAKDPELVEAKSRARHAPEWSSSKDQLKGQVFTDGSAIHPE
eukprot:11373112-Heterocapsa_arctica.AAC.1